MTLHVGRPTDLLSHVGESIGTTDWIEITQARVDEFADATGDHQWIHVDPDRAAAGPFGRTVVHGFLTLALSPVALYELLVIDHLEASVNYGLNKVRFPAALPVGTRVRLHIEITAVAQKPAGVEVTFQVTTEADEGDRPVCVAEQVVLYR
ncbi:MaoC family dehydratase [Tsukamurella soli]|uniref:MaoC family dehydratase n=1 Tax=Tsukamurella soli TaxID=644556 RepID=A0ABP8JFP4_9ACTN